MTAQSMLYELYALHRARLASLEIEADLARPVYGVGTPGAQLMLIGEAPGKNEAEQATPFVGKAGKQLDGFLHATGLARDEIFVTNAVKYRPTKNIGRSNRTPTRKEILKERYFVMEEIRIVRPAVVATLGNSPLYAVTGDAKLTVGQVHAHSFTVPEGFILFPLYHPASIIYNPSLTDTYLQDLAKLKELLENLQTSGANAF